MAKIECYDNNGDMFCEVEVLRVELNDDIMELGADLSNYVPAYMVYVSDDDRRLGCMTYDEFRYGKPGVHVGADSPDYADWDDFEEHIVDELFRYEYAEDVDDGLAVLADGLIPWVDGAPQA